MSLHEYASMLRQGPRIDAFRAAIEREVEPGMSVLDLGTGLGTYAMFAARAGAGRVVAVDSSDVVLLARSLARENGLADRIEFLQARAPEGLLDERWDLVVFEDYPTNLLDGPGHALLRAVAEKHLTPGGRLLPDRARLALAPVRAEAVRLDPPTGEGPGGLRWTELRDRLVHTGTRVHLPESALAGEPHMGPRLELLPPPGPAALGLEGRWTGIDETVAALALWFDLDLGDGLEVSNRPESASGAWGQWLLPLESPLGPGPGGVLEAGVTREEGEDGGPGFTSWWCRRGESVRRGHEFGGLLLSPQKLGLSGGTSTGSVDGSPKKA